VHLQRVVPPHRRSPGRRKFPQTLEGFFVGGSGGGGVNDWQFINLSGKSVPLVNASFSFLKKLICYKRKILFLR
jgi:hypothetical protein